MPNDNLLEQLEKHIDQRFDSQYELLKDIKLATAENTKWIIEMQGQQRNTQGELNEWKTREADQHKEFYARLTESEKQIERLKTIVWLLGGAVPLIATVIGIIISMKG